MATTAGTTPNRSYPYPGDSSTTNVPGDLKAALLAVDTDVAALNAAGNVSTADIADSAVTSAKIADGTIVNADISASAAIDKTKISGTAVVQARSVATGGPLSGGGDLSSDRTITVATAAITPIYLGLAYAAKSAGYTLTDDDYEVDFTAAPYTATLPSASGRAGRVFIVRNSASSGTITVSGASTTLPGPGYVIVRSNGTTWTVVEGAYADASAGLASYRWNAASAAWRLIAYDTGVRAVSCENALWDTVASLTIARTGNWVEMCGRLTTTAGGTWAAATAALYTLPSGFRPADYVQQGTGLLTSGGTRYPAAPSTAGTTTQLTIDILGASIAPAAGATLTFGAKWRTAPGTLPSSLPGTTVTNPV